MPFTTYIPCDALKPYIKSFAISENEKAHSYKVLPGTSIVMGFQFSGQLSYTSNDKLLPLKNAGVTGLNTTFRVFSDTDRTGTVLVMFSEAGASAFFSTPLHEIFGHSLGLDDLILKSQMDVVAEQLNEAGNNIQRIQAVENFLLSRLKPGKEDKLVITAIGLIKAAKGTIKIAELAKKLNISESQFEKRFRAIAGASPKKFSSIVRLQNIVSARPGRNGLTALGLDAGYYDQAHFIKDFKSFTGETPEEFFTGK